MTALLCGALFLVKGDSAVRWEHGKRVDEHSVILADFDPDDFEDAQRAIIRIADHLRNGYRITYTDVFAAPDDAPGTGYVKIILERLVNSRNY